MSNECGGVISSAYEHNTPLKLRDAITALAAGSFESSDTWLVDSGANMHITNDMKWYKSFTPVDITINTADGASRLQIKGGGTVQFCMLTPDGATVEVTLSEVAYAPSGRCNLLSLSLFSKKANIEGRWSAKSMIFENSEGYQIGYAQQVDGLYELALAPSMEVVDMHTDILPSVQQPLAAVIDLEDAVMMWHRRMGHLGFQNLRRLKGFSKGMDDITDKQLQAKLKTICPICAMTDAIQKVPRDPASRHAQEVGFLMHADTWGKYAIKGWDDTQYFLLITDDFTRFTWVIRFTRKKDLSQAFRKLYNDIETSRGIKIRNYRLDGEFSNGPIGQWLEKHHISIEPTTPYDHY